MRKNTKQKACYLADVSKPLYRFSAAQARLHCRFRHPCNIVACPHVFDVCGVPAPPPPLAQFAGRPETGDPEDNGMDAQPPSDEKLLLRRDDAGVAWLTLNRPPARNALSVGLMPALEAALDDAAADPAVRVVVIAGAGPAFCAGHDLRELRANPGRAAYRGAVRPVRGADDAHRPPAQAGDRAGARRGDGGRLPAGGELRSGGGGRDGALRHPGRQYRPVLLDADGGAVPRGRRARRRWRCC